VVIENKPGAGGNVGATYVARAPADGHVMFIASSPGFVNAAALSKDAGFDPLKDFVAVAMLATQPMLLNAHPSLAAGNIVPYPGVAKSLPDLLGGQLQVLMANPADVGNLIRDGRVRGLAVASKTREKTLPEVPTFTEQGFPEVIGSTWFGVAAPAGLPKPILDRLHTEIHTLMKKPATAERLAQLGMNIILNNPDEFLAYIKSEIAKWAPIIKASGVVLN